MAQIAADALELPLERVKVFHGSTTYLPDGVGAFGSRSTVMGGSAIVLAADALIAKFRAAAAEKFGVAVAEVGVVEGVAVTPRRPQACARRSRGPLRRRRVPQFESDL